MKCLVRGKRIRTGAISFLFKKQKYRRRYRSDKETDSHWRKSPLLFLALTTTIQNEEPDEEVIVISSLNPNHILISRLVDSISSEKSIPANLKKIKRLYFYAKSYSGFIPILVALEIDVVLTRYLEALPKDYPQKEKLVMNTVGLLEIVTKESGIVRRRMLGCWMFWCDVFSWSGRLDSDMAKISLELLDNLVHDDIFIQNIDMMKVVDVSRIVIQNRSLDQESLFLVTNILSDLSSDSDQFTKDLVDHGIAHLLRCRLYPTSKKDNKNLKKIDDSRALVLVARILGNISQLDQKYKLYILEDDWIEVLRSFTKFNNNKELLMATIHALDHLLLNDVIAAQLIKDYDMNMLIQLVDLIDIDLQHGVEKIIMNLKNNPVEETETSRVFLLDENYHIMPLNN